MTPPAEHWRGMNPKAYVKARQEAVAALAGTAGSETVKTWVIRIPTSRHLNPAGSKALAEALTSSLREFRVDQRQLLASIAIAAEGEHVRLEVRGQSDDEVKRIVAELTRLLRDPPGAAPRRNRSRPWAIGASLIAMITVVLSLLTLSTESLLALGLSSAAIAAATCTFASRRQQRGLNTLLAMTPVLLMVAFALVYGAVGVGHECAAGTVAARGGPATALAPGCDVVSPDGEAHLRDPLILSLQAMVTGGFGDIGVYGWTRTVVYLEMLLLWAAVAVALVALARRFERVNIALDERRDIRSL